IIIADSPPGYDWGCYSREDPRMHLQTVDRQHRNLYKIWLEVRGRRTIELATKIKSDVLKEIRSAIRQQRQTVEDHWVEFMIHQRWLQAHLAVPRVTLVGYPDTPNRFTRTVDLTQHILPEEAEALTHEDIRLSPEMASLQIWPWRPEGRRQDIRLSTILWQG